MPAGFMPKGIVVNHSSAGSLSRQYWPEPMNASIVPCEVASKQANCGMIWPPGNTSMRNRPSVISSTIFASCCAAPCRMSLAAVHAVDIRHCTFGCAMTRGALAMTAAPTAAAPAALIRNRRRSGIAGLHRDVLMERALGDVVPRAHQRLELRERRVNLPGQRTLLGLLADDLRRQLPQIAQHRRGQLQHVDLALELRLEPGERGGVLGVEIGEAVHLHGRGGVIERAAQIDRQCVVGLAIEAELAH